MTAMIRLVLGLVLLSTLSACSTLCARALGEGASPYVGAEFDVDIIVHSVTNDDPISDSPLGDVVIKSVFGLLAFISLPLDFVVDTLLLPYDLYAVSHIDAEEEDHSALGAYD